MAIRREEVQRIAALARLEVPPEQLDALAAELSAVLDYAQVLQRLDLTDYEPLSFAPADVPLRDDGPDGCGLTAGEALGVAPEAEAGFFLVPPVVEKPGS